MKFEFDHMKDLFESDPVEFERVRTELLEDLIATAPVDRQDQLKAKQWRIEHELNKFNDPIARMNKMVSILWDGVNDLIETTRNPVTAYNKANVEPYVSNIVAILQKYPEL